MWILSSILNKHRISVFLLAILVLFSFHFYSKDSISASYIEINTACQAGSASIRPVHYETDFDYMTSSGTVIRSADESIRLFMNFRTKQSRLGIYSSVLLFAIAFVMALFPYLIYGIAIHLYGRCMVPVWQIIRYIHLLDGEKDASYILI